jgi:predicted phage tail protein
VIRVVLHGPITRKFPAEHLFAIRNPREAVAAISANYTGLCKE